MGTKLCPSLFFLGLFESHPTRNLLWFVEREIMDWIWRPLEAVALTRPMHRSNESTPESLAFDSLPA